MVETKWPFKPEDDVTSVNKEAMDAIEKRLEDSTCHSVGGKLCDPEAASNQLKSLYTAIERFKKIIDSSVETHHAEPLREQMAIEAKGMTSYQIKTLLEDTVHNMRKVREYCESTDYNTEVYEYHNSDCFYYELHDIRSMSDEIIKNFEKKLDTDIK